MYDVIEETREVCKRNREDYEELAQMTGKPVAEIEADTTAPDSSEEIGIDWGGAWGKPLHKLSGNLGAAFDGGEVILYNTSAYNPKRLAVITSGEMATLMSLYTDGCCPVCLKEIALYDIICDDCLENARNMRRLGPAPTLRQERKRKGGNDDNR